MAEGEEPWAVVVRETIRSRVHVLPTPHRLLGLDQRGARLLVRPKAHGQLALAVRSDLTVDDALAWSASALAPLSQGAWRAFAFVRGRALASAGRGRRMVRRTFAEHLCRVMALRRADTLWLAAHAGATPDEARALMAGAAPTVHQLERICRALDVSADYLLGLGDEGRPPPDLKALLCGGRILWGSRVLTRDEQERVAMAIWQILGGGG